VRALLDTHTFLWFVLDDPRLGSAARGVIEDEANEILVSPASFWELAIKISLGKYTLVASYESFWGDGIAKNDFTMLPIEIRHTAALLTLPFHHKDPFDRLLIAQAISEDIPLLSADENLSVYDVKRIW
jgi:PIN domain nuclease of toxin-antitoxin system